MLAFSKRALSSSILIFILFCSPYFLGAQPIEFSEDHQEVSRLFVSPKECPVISPALMRFLTDCSFKDSVKVWVFFTDKGIFSQEQYQQAKATFKNSLTGSAQKRRSRNKVKIDLQDLPVNQNYVDEVLEL